MLRNHVKLSAVQSLLETETTMQEWESLVLDVLYQEGSVHLIKSVASRHEELFFNIGKDELNASLPSSPRISMSISRTTFVTIEVVCEKDSQNCRR